MAKKKAGGWHVNLRAAEEAIWHQDDFFRAHFNLLEQVRNSAEKKIIANNATKDLEAIVKAGCDRDELLFLLGMCENRGVSSTVKLTGYDSEQMASNLAAIRKCAVILTEINNREFGLFLEDRRHFFKYLRLPKLLDQYASLVEHAMKSLGGKTDFYLHLAKGRLIHYVHIQTGKFYDSAVAELLSAVLDLPYTYVDHRVWRNTYHQRMRSYAREDGESPVLRVKKTLLERRAATLYRMDALGETAPIRKKKPSVK